MDCSNYLIHLTPYRAVSSLIEPAQSEEKRVLTIALTILGSIFFPFNLIANLIYHFCFEPPDAQQAQKVDQCAQSTLLQPPPTVSQAPIQAAPAPLFVTLWGGSQGGCIGPVEQGPAKHLCVQLNQKREQGVLFNARSLVQNLVGGTCSAISFHLIHLYLSIKSQADRQHFQAQVALASLSCDYLRSNQAFRNVQAAYNTIEKHPTEQSDDFRKSKINAMLKLYNREVVFCSNACDVSQPNASSEVATVLAALPRGAFLVRQLFESRNARLEDHGHSCAFINEENEQFFYDPNYGVKILSKQHSAEALCGMLRTAHATWNVPLVRFYQVSD